MLADTREKLAEACSSVEGVTVSPYYRQSVKPGTGLVRFGGLQRPNAFPADGLVTWQVVLFLHSDIGQAERWIDTHLPQVLSAVRNELHGPIGVEPQQLVLDTGTVPVVVIQGTREEA